MPGRGPAPKQHGRRTHHEPIRGNWQPTIGTGWQHDPFPQPPDGLLKASRDAWDIWMHAWFAAHWTPEDLPGLRQVVRLYDQVERGDFVRAGELRLWLDTMGISPKGQQDRRWLSNVGNTEKPLEQAPTPTPYAHLRVVNE